MSDSNHRYKTDTDCAPEFDRSAHSLNFESTRSANEEGAGHEELLTAPLWRTAQVDPQRAERLAQRLQVPLRVARWACARTRSEQEAQDWLQPQETVTALPWSLFHGLAAATERIWAAVEAGEKICVVGDYDVDGVTASALLASSLEAMGADWQCIIPHRVEDGYGLSEALAQRAAKAGAKLIVTVDNGIHADAAIRHAVQLGMDVVLTDHHQPGSELPHAACAVVHWADADEVDAVSMLSGAGVARKVVDALVDSAHARGMTNTAAQLEALTPWHDALAALGTLADLMPMRGENRRLVRAGIRALRTTGHLGWRALCTQVGVEQGTVTESGILWSVTPRLNAAGRMGSAMVAFELLMAKSLIDAEVAAQQIETWNQLRREVTQRAAQEAVEACTRRFGEQLPAGLVVAGPWPLGVVGIVAARLCDEYQRAAIVLADDGSGHLRGSGRAPQGFPLHETVTRCAEYLDHFGGHEAAIGCGLASEQLNDFCAAFAEHAQAWQDAQDAGHEPSDEQSGAVPSAPLADDYLPLAEATLATMDWVSTLGPFGPGNPLLAFYLGPLEVAAVRVMGKQNQHLRIQVREGSSTAELVWFQAQPSARAWRPGTRIAVVAQLEDNTWQGVRRAQLRVVSAHLLAPTLVAREAFSEVYQLLRARRRVQLRDFHTTGEMDTERLRFIFDTFVELGFARCEESAYHMVDRANPSDLRESPSYQQHLARARLNP